MTAFLIYKLILSFCVGGLAVVIVTFLAERLGGRLGGILAGFPVTIFASLLFIATIHGPENIQPACSAALASLSLFGFFCVTYVYLVHFGYYRALLAALGVWVSAATVMLYVNINTLALAVIIFAVIASISLWFLRRKKNDFPENKTNTPKPLWVYVMRFCAVGFVVAFAGYLSTIMGGKAGGVMAGIPATAISSSFILYRSANKELVANFLRSQCKGSLLSCSCYIIAVYFLYPAIGIIWGTLGALSVSLIVTTSLYQYNTRKFDLALKP